MMDGNQEIPPPSPNDPNGVSSLGSALLQLRVSSSSSSLSPPSSGSSSRSTKRPASSSSLLPPSLSKLTSSSSTSSSLSCLPPLNVSRKASLPVSPSDLSSDWQCRFPTIRERNSVMLNSDVISDVSFLVGDEEHDGRTVLIPAHKYVLSISSPAFFAMFHGGLSACGEQDVVRITDIQPQAFQTLLRYIYTDEVNLSADTALGTLYAAKKYLIHHLASCCVEFLERSLMADNACLYLCQSRMFEESGLMNKCWQVIDAQAEQALAAPCFQDVDQNTLDDIIRRDTLVTRELSVFKAVMTWAEAECARQGRQPTADNKRSVLGNSLFLLRLPMIDMKQFADTVVSSGILTVDETKDLFLYYVATQKPPISFLSKARTGLAMRRCARFQASAFRSNQWRYRGRCDSIQFATDRRVFVAGVALYGSSNGATTYAVNLELKNKHGTLLKHDYKFRSDGSSKTFPIILPAPALVEAGTYHTVSVILAGQELSFFGQEGLAEVIVPAELGSGDGGSNITFTFQASQDSTNGTGVQGGQIPEILFYMV